MKSITLPLLVSTRTMQNLVGRTKMEHQTASVEAVTGRARDIADHLGGDTGRIHRLDKLVADATRRIASLNELQTEAQNMQTTLGSIERVASGLGVEIEAALGLDNNQSLLTLQTEAEAELTAIWGRLNTNFNGDYQFSGAAVDTAPLGDLATFVAAVQTDIAGAATIGDAITALDTFFNDTVAGTFHTATYQGSTTAAPDRQVSESRRLGLDVKAIDPGIRNVLRGLVVMQVADSAATPEIAEQLKAEAAQNLMNGGAQIIQTQASVGIVESDAESLISQHESEKEAYEFTRLDLLGIDQYDAASRMQLLQTQLEASYLTTARIANLTLANYL